MADNSYTFLMSGGGTGGHVYPAIAIADAIRRKLPDSKIAFAGSRERIEWKAVPKAGYEIYPIWISGLQRRLTLKNLLVPVKLMTSLVQSLRIIKKLKPDAVVCTGGYVAGPVGWMAGKLGIPVFLQEQNSYPGVTTRLLSAVASRVFTVFSEAEAFLGKAAGRISLLGNPARKEITNPDKSRAHEVFELDSGRPTLLVLGGSGGAAAINNAVRDSLEELHDRQGFQIIWQCGPAYYRELADNPEIGRYKSLRLMDFIDDMAAAYNAADLVVSRAGAGICTELMISGKPSILVPSPNVAGNHQHKNAEAMVQAGAAEILEDREATEKLAETVKNLLADSGRLKEMQKAALHMAKPDAAEAIAAEIIDFLDNRRKNA